MLKNIFLLNFISINNALTVDLTGQIASESIGFSMYSGTGGQADFLRGATQSKGGKSFIALKSTSKPKEDGSFKTRIVSYSTFFSVSYFYIKVRNSFASFWIFYVTCKTKWFFFGCLFFFSYKNNTVFFYK